MTYSIAANLGAAVMPHNTATMEKIEIEAAWYLSLIEKEMSGAGAPAMEKMRGRGLEARNEANTWPVWEIPGVLLRNNS